MGKRRFHYKKMKLFSCSEVFNSIMVYMLQQVTLIKLKI